MQGVLTGRPGPGLSFCGVGGKHLGSSLSVGETIETIADEVPGFRVIIHDRRWGFPVEFVRQQTNILYLAFSVVEQRYLGIGPRE